MCIKTIYISLGKTCNLNCVYCTQEHEKYKPVNINTNIYREITNITETVNIIFFGGEPLIYFKEIKEIVNTIVNTKKNINFSIITNGLLLNQEIINFCNHNKISITISYDGPIQEITRGFNPLKDKLYEILSIDTLSISCVISNLNTDIYSIWEDLQHFETNTGRYLPVYFEFIKNFNNELTDNLCLTYNDTLEKSLDKIIENFLHQIGTNTYNTREWEFLSSYLKSIKFRDTLNSIEPSCLVGYSVAHIDLLGNLYSCHGSTEILGNINTLGLQPGKKNKLPHTCNVCKYLKFCGGGCVLLDGKGKQEECYYQTSIYSRIEKLLIYLQYRPDLLYTFIRGSNDSNI